MSSQTIALSGWTNIGTGPLKIEAKSTCGAMVIASATQPTTTSGDYYVAGGAIQNFESSDTYWAAPGQSASSAFVGVEQIALGGSGGGSSVVITGQSAGLGLDASLQSILTAVKATVNLSGTVWYDQTVNPPVYYIRRETVNEGTGVVTVAWYTPAGSSASPTTANLAAVSNASDIATDTDVWSATASATGVAVGDILFHTFGVDTSVAGGSLAYSFWLNGGPSASAGTVLSAAPSSIVPALQGVSIADGGSVTLGAKADAIGAVATGSAGSWSLVSIAKQLAVSLAGYLSVNLGIGGAAVSRTNAVYIADAYANAVTGTWNNTTVAGASGTGATVSVPTGGMDGVMLSIVASGTVSSGHVTFEAYDGAAWLPIKGFPLESYYSYQGYPLASGLNNGLQFDLSGCLQFRVRLDTAITGSGSVLFTLNASSAPLVPGLVAGLDPTTANPVTMQAGSNIIGKVGIDQTTPGTTNGVVVNSSVLPTGAAADGTDSSIATMPTGGVGIRGWLSGIYAKVAGTLTVSWSGQSVTIATVSLPSTSTSSAASSLVLKSAPGSLVTLDVVAGAVAGYIMLFDATAAPADGAVSPKWVFAMAAGGALTEDWTNPLSFATGIIAVFSSTGPFIKTASATAFMAGQVQ